MARNFKYEYEQHIRNTAPDMDKLWNRIESEIDSRENTEKQSITYSTNNNARAKKGHKGLAAAAAIVIVILGARLFSSTNQPDTDNSNGKSDISSSANSADNAEETIENNDTDTIYDNNSTEEVLSYNLLSLSSTNTLAYKCDYEAQGDEYFVEQNVLEQTDCFADVTVTEASLNAYGADYTLKVNRLITSNGEESSFEELTIYSSTPYILQQNREYFIPLKQENGQWYIVFENAPQIEITLDGGVVFQNGWDSLEENSCTVDKEELNRNDFYYDRMKYCDEMDLQNLIDKWRSI